MGIFIYPYLLSLFLLRDVLIGSIILSKNIILYWLNLVSTPLLIKTFFAPLKNEYRDGLVIFSILMGMIVKTILLISIFIITVIMVIILGIIILALILSPLIIFTSLL